MYNKKSLSLRHMRFVGILSKIKQFFGPLVIQVVWYILKQLFNSVSVKVVDIYLHFGEQLLTITTKIRPKIRAYTISMKIKRKYIVCNIRIKIRPKHIVSCITMKIRPKSIVYINNHEKMLYFKDES